MKPNPTHAEEARFTANANTTHRFMAPDAGVFCVRSQECAGEEDVQTVGWRCVSVTSQTDQRGDAQERYKMVASSSAYGCFSLCLTRGTEETSKPLETAVFYFCVINIIEKGL